MSEPRGLKLQLPKRYACDRCREHKLRCPRDEQTGESCTRCVRAGAQCVTGNSRPLGRPAKATNDQTGRKRRNIDRRNDESTEKNVKKVKIHENPTHGIVATPRVMAERPPELRKPEDRTDNLSSWFQTKDSDLFGIGSDLFCGMDDTNDDFFAAVLDNSDHGLYFSTGTPMAGPNPLEAYVELSESEPSNGGFASQDHTSSGEDDTSKSPEEQEQDKPLDKTSLVRRLSALHIHLSEQLDRFNSSLWDVTLWSIVCSDDSENGVSPKNTYTFGDVLQSTSEFLNVLQSFALLDNSAMERSIATPFQPTIALLGSDLTTPSSPSSNGPLFSDIVGTVQPLKISSLHTGPGHATRSVSDVSTESGADTVIPRLDIATVLVVLACYSQIIRISNILFNQVHEKLSEKSGPPTSSLQTVPDLRLEWFSVQDETLRIQKLLQAVEQLFSHIERVLGLSPVFRLDPSQASCHGILSGLKMIPLLQTIMAQKDTDTFGEGRSAGDISSLRKSIKEIKHLLQINYSL